MMNILIPVLTLTGLGFIFGIGLGVAAKKFCTTADPRIEEIFKKLPGVNCGACGRPGCMAFAEALIKGECSLEKCRVAKKEAREEITQILEAGKKGRAG